MICQYTNQQQTTNTVADNVNSQLYNFERILQMPNMDEAFLNKLSSVYIKTTTKDLRTLNQAVKNKDYEALRKIAHKLKSSIDTLNIDSLKDVIRQIETYHPKNRLSEEKLTTWIDFTNKTLRKVIKDLKLRLETEDSLSQ
jgi:HPt (histidine-containing phosphotransfer) domain-containing protein